MDNLELISFKIIASVGVAKSKYLEAVSYAQQGEYEKSQKLIEEGDVNYLKGHEAHARLVQNESAGENTIPSVLLMHAEDQLMATETVKMMAQNIIQLTKEINQIKENINEKSISIL